MVFSVRLLSHRVFSGTMSLLENSVQSQPRMTESAESGQTKSTGFRTTEPVLVSHLDARIPSILSTILVQIQLLGEMLWEQYTTDWSKGQWFFGFWLLFFRFFRVSFRRKSSIILDCRFISIEIWSRRGTRM